MLGQILLCVLVALGFMCESNCAPRARMANEEYERSLPFANPVYDLVNMVLEKNSAETAKPKLGLLERLQTLQRELLERETLKVSV